MTRSDKQRRSVHRILEMYASLGLAVCDDEEAICTRRDEQRSVRNRELNSTKGSVAARAQQWFDDVNLLLNRRGELLGVLYTEFCSLADTVLKAALDGDRTTLGADTQLALRDLAMSWCGARSDLANRWLAEYLEQRGLKNGGPLEQPSKVRDFRVVPRAGRINLSWALPPEPCDEVLILRTPDPLTTDGVEARVYQGRGTSFVDTNVSPKGHYIYRAYTLFEGKRSLTSSTARTRQSVTRRPSATVTTIALAALVLGGLVAWPGAIGGETSLLADLLDSFDSDTQDGTGDGGWPGADAASSDGQGSGTAASTGATGDDGRDAARQPDGSVAPGVNGSLDAFLAETVRDAGSTADPTTNPVSLATDEPGSSPRSDSQDPTPRPALEVSAVRAPTLAFGGRSLLLELQSNRPLGNELVAADLEGLTVKRVELDGPYPAVRFQVHTAPSGDAETWARWSFQVVTEDGETSDPITGRCLVIPSR